MIKIKGKKKVIAFAMSVLILMPILIYSFISIMYSNDENQVIAEVNGERILKKDFMNIYEQEKTYSGITDENDPEQIDIIKNLKADILEQLISEKLVAQKAKEAGFIMNSEYLSEASKEFDSLLESLAEDMKAQGEQENIIKGSQEYIKEAQEYVNSELEAMGVTRDEYNQAIAEQKVIGDFIEEMTKDVKVTDEDVQKYYDAQLEIQKSRGFSSEYDYVSLLDPAEARVKHVLIELPQEQRDEYNRLVTEESEEAAGNYLEEKLVSIKPKAQEVLDKARNRGDFEKLIEEYGQDPGMIDNEEGYIVRQDGQFVKEFEDAAFSLKEGEISDLVASDYGFHIIKLYEKKNERVYSFEEKKDELLEAVRFQKQSELWDSLVKGWLNAADIVRFENRL